MRGAALGMGGQRALGVPARRHGHRPVVVDMNGLDADGLADVRDAPVDGRAVGFPVVLAFAPWMP